MELGAIIMVVYLLQIYVEKKFFLEKIFVFLQNIYYLQKKCFYMEQKFFTDKNINENVK